MTVQGVERLGKAVLVFRNMLDVDGGMKRDTGWKACTDRIGLKAAMPERMTATMHPAVVWALLVVMFVVDIAWPCL